MECVGSCEVRKVLNVRKPRLGLRAPRLKRSLEFLPLIVNEMVYLRMANFKS